MEHLNVWDGEKARGFCCGDRSVCVSKSAGVAKSAICRQRWRMHDGNEDDDAEPKSVTQVQTLISTSENTAERTI